MPKQTKILKVHPKDNVLVALTNLQKGDLIEYTNGSICLKENIKAKHKLVTHNLTKGGEIIMYGVVVGRAKKNIF